MQRPLHEQVPPALKRHEEAQDKLIKQQAEFIEYLREAAATRSSELESMRAPREI